MSRNFTIDAKVFNLKRDIHQIARLYPSSQEEVRQFLASQKVYDNLQGMQNEQIYELISSELGYPIPR